MPHYIFNCLNCGKQVSIGRYDSIPKYCSHACHDAHRAAQIAENTLRDLYIQQRLSMNAIGEQLDVSGAIIRRLLIRYGIPTRGTPRPRTYPAADELRRMYVDEQRSTKDIAIDYGVTDVTVQNWLRKHRIPARSNFELHHADDDARLPTEKELRILYPLGYSAGAIGAMFGVHGATILNLMKKGHIERRAPGRLQKFLTCEDGHVVRSGLELLVDNWLWRHGVLHTVEPHLPFKGKGDFLVGDLWIEVWGLSTKYNESSLFRSALRSYSKRRAEKERLYKEHQLTLLGLEPYDVLHHLDDRLNHLLG